MKTPLLILAALLLAVPAFAQNQNFTNVTIGAAGAIHFTGGGSSATLSGAGSKVITGDFQALSYTATTATSYNSTGNMNLTSPGSIGLNAGSMGTIQFNRPLALTYQLDVPNGGTGAVTFTQYGVLYGSGTSPFGVTSAGTSGQVLTSNGSGAAPTYQTVAAGGGISGATTGDIIVATGATTGTSKPAQINSSGDITARNFTGATIQGVTFVSTSATSYTSTGNMNIVSPGSIGFSAGVAGTFQFNRALALTVPLDAANGGLGTTTLTAHGVVIGNGTSTAHVTSAGTAGQVLTSNGASADPTFQAAGGTGTVTSVGMTVPAFLSVTPSTINSSGTFAVSLSGTALPVSNGGTGNTTFGTGQIPYGNGTGALGKTSNATLDASGNLTINGNLSMTAGDQTFVATHGVTGGTSTSLTVGYSGYKSGVGLNSGSAISLTSNTPVDVVSHTFPAGHWLIWGNVWFSQGAGTSTTFYVGGISTVSGNLPGVDSARETQTAAPITSSGVAGNISITPYSFDITTPTTYYLVSAAVFSGGTLSTFGGMSWLQTP